MTLTVALLLKLIMDLQATRGIICNSIFLEKRHTWLHGKIGVKWRVNIIIEILSLGIISVQCEKVKEITERFSKMTYDFNCGAIAEANNGSPGNARHHL